uniref:Ig-like domain-containing protein n=1 Tax=Leptobrachium leishanense TaxID=445787 RepID=A0A8C5R024_9ANUR
MSSFVSFIGSVTCCCLVMHQVSGEGLPKPTLTYMKDIPKNVVVIGDKIDVTCQTASSDAQAFFLKQTKGLETTWRNQSTDTFTFNEIQQSQSGDYACFYCDQMGSKCSEDSNRVYIYVRDEFPRPDISISPRRIVLAGDSATITCKTSFTNIAFSIYKGDTRIDEYPNGKSTISYDIKNADQTHAGAYTCRFRRTLENSKQIVSSESNPMHVKVEDLSKPSIADEIDPNGHKIRFYCAAASKNQILSFQLLSEKNGIEMQTKMKDVRNATFIIDKPTRTTKYFCNYRVKIDFDMAYSRSSDVRVVTGKDYTAINITRLLFSAVILVLLGVILWKESVNFTKSEDEYPPKPPSARGRSASLAEDTEVVCQSDV